MTDKHDEETLRQELRQAREQLDRLVGDLRDRIASLETANKDLEVSLSRQKIAEAEAEMASAERTRWAKQLPNLAKEWADRLEKRGLPGRKVIKTFMDEARAMKVSIARHWDRE